MRIATFADIDEVSTMANKFISLTEYKHHYDAGVLEDVLITLLKLPPEEGIVLIEDNKGMILGRTSTFAFGNKKMAVEFGWWVDPDARKEGVGKQLIEAFEYWAKKIQCDLVVMVSIDDEVGKYYEKIGYKLIERMYMKELN